MNDRTDQLADVTERYARYSRSAGGLSLVIGSILMVLAFALGPAAAEAPWLRLVLISAPVLWLLSKELLRIFYYQREGAAVERVSDKLRRQHRGMVIYLAAVSLLILLGNLFLGGLEQWDWPRIGYLVFVLALPLIAARWFWSVSDFLVGVLLFCQAAIVTGGGHYPGYWLLLALLYAAIAVPVGVREHRDYLCLRRELEQLAAPAEHA
ncbi:hypothetical protein [Novilysobacter spongiicola]|uniref:Uncharacterized protein n=1 Tax=Lysobacter spongiicola DSM 21749 TaxID=1122188 RepID=A0A1T4LNR9_9GAMM|nr:hypothetical protein [Lysobacter spongiicola]SJZ56104.1 hypothetical protein SAMN02745674_00081 [Lysobacter spongiicola DSM 21749]